MSSFVRYDQHGFAMLKNTRGYCVFYDLKKHRCKVYVMRPMGCRIYPVIYSEDEGVIVDDLCPEANTISEIEKDQKSKKLIKLLDSIDSEAEERSRHS